MLLVFSVTALCLSVAALILHYTNGMLSTSNSIISCNTVPTATLKYLNKYTLLLVTFACIAVGIFFALCLAITSLMWVIRMRSAEQSSVTNTLRATIYMLAALALLGTTVGYGYYQSFVIEYQRYSCPNVLNNCLIQNILLAISTGCLASCTVLSMILPRQTIYHTSQQHRPLTSKSYKNLDHKLPTHRLLTQ
jgi:hypothetical protein